MGLTATKFTDRMFGEKLLRVVVVGLLGSGKTTMLKKLEEAIGTLEEWTCDADGGGGRGFVDVETLYHHNLHVSSWDFEDEELAQAYPSTCLDFSVFFDMSTTVLADVDPETWFESSDVEDEDKYIKAVIFVVDTHADQQGKLDKAADYLHKLIERKEFKDAVILIYANKQDEENSLALGDIRDRLGVDYIKERQVYLQACQATEGKGLFEGLDWVTKALKIQFRGKNE